MDNHAYRDGLWTQMYRMGLMEDVVQPVKKLWLFMACGWYGALGRVVDFEMCHLRSRGRVANFKNEVFRNGGMGFEIFDFLTCCTWKRHRLHMLSYDRQGGVGGDVNVRVERFPHGTEEAHVAFVVVWSSGGVGGDVNVRIEHFLYVTEEVAVADILHCLMRFLRISCVNLCWSWLDFL